MVRRRGLLAAPAARDRRADARRTARSSRGDFTGDGPVDAIFRAINAATRREARLREFRIDVGDRRPGRARRGQRRARARGPVGRRPGRLDRHHRGRRARLRARAVQRGAARGRGRRRRGRGGRPAAHADALTRPGRTPRRAPTRRGRGPSGWRPSRRPSPRRGRPCATIAPRERSASVSAATAASESARSGGDPAGERRRDEAQHARAAPGRGGVEVRRAPDAAVDVLAAADLHRREDPRHGARREHGLRRPGRRARRARRTSRAGRCGGRPPRSAGGRRTREPMRVEVARRGRPSERSVAGVARRTAARTARPAGAVPASASGANGVAAAIPARPAAPVAAAQRVRARPARPPLAHSRAARSPASRAPAGGQRGGDDRAGRRADEVLAVAEVQSGRRLQPAQPAAQPRLAERAADAEDEDVGQRGDGRGHPRGSSARPSADDPHAPHAVVRLARQPHAHLRAQRRRAARAAPELHDDRPRAARPGAADLAADPLAVRRPRGCAPARPGRRAGGRARRGARAGGASRARTASRRRRPSRRRPPPVSRRRARRPPRGRSPRRARTPASSPAGPRSVAVSRIRSHRRLAAHAEPGEQRRDAGHVRRGLRGPGQHVVGRRRHGGEDVLAVDRQPAAAGRDDGRGRCRTRRRTSAAPAPVHRADAQQPVLRRRAARRPARRCCRPPRRPRSPPPARGGSRRRSRRRPSAPTIGDLGAEREVDHVGVLLARVVDPARDRRRGRRCRRRRAPRTGSTFAPGATDATPIAVARRGDRDAGHVRAVARRRPAACRRCRRSRVPAAAVRARSGWFAAARPSPRPRSPRPTRSRSRAPRRPRSGRGSTARRAAGRRRPIALSTGMQQGQRGPRRAIRPHSVSPHRRRRARNRCT